MAENQQPSNSSCRDSCETLEVDRTVTPRTYILSNNIIILCISILLSQQTRCYNFYICIVACFAGCPGAFCVTLEHRFPQFEIVI